MVVITGASSGLGRALALEMARRGASLVLAARRLEVLEDVARQCQAAGGSAIAVQTDVTVEADVQRLLARTLEHAGRIDIWVNNAGVTLYALLEQGPFEPHRRVLETNLFGAILGARAVVPVFRRQHRGVLINVGSVLSQIGQAFVPAYTISKFGVHGLSEALRVELADERDVHVCTAFPYAIDTPHFQVAANQLGLTPRALPPVQSPEKVAFAIADLAERPRRTLFVPRFVVLGLALHALVPRTVERLLLDTLRRWHLSTRPERISDGNLYEGAPGDAKVQGDRPPMLSTAKLLVWAVGDLAKLQLTSLRRRTGEALAALGAGGESARGRGAPPELT
ncbi:MAG: SDR family NAD(P)-dependent oxidoreductase [Deltaproteobacteria bacterium]|nr:SDR family NAD(P)-dependent oxidoreductase [Deltaproteobacteria bacterium]